MHFHTYVLLRSNGGTMQPFPPSILEELRKCLWQSWKISCWPAWLWLSVKTSKHKFQTSFFEREKKSVLAQRERIFQIINWPTQYKIKLWKCFPKMKDVKNTGFWAFQLQHCWNKLTTAARGRISRFPSFIRPKLLPRRLNQSMKEDAYAALVSRSNIIYCGHPACVHKKISVNIH